MNARQNVLLTERNAAYLFLSFLTIWSVTALTRYLPGLNQFSMYFAITVSFAFSLLLFLHINQYIKIHKYIFCMTLIIAIIVAIYRQNDIASIAGDFLRLCTLLFILLSLKTKPKFDYEEFLNLSLRYIICITTIIIFLKYMLVFNFNLRNVGIELPCIALGMGISLSLRNWYKFSFLVILGILSGKEASLIACAGLLCFLMIYRFASLRNILMTTVSFFFLYYISPYVLEYIDVNGSKKLRSIVALIYALFDLKIDDGLLNLVTSNRWSEYRSVFDYWSNNGYPVLGYGIGAEVPIYIDHRNVYETRSTLHNSFLALYHKFGVFGLFLSIYLFRKTAANIKLFLPMLGVFIYCSFNYSLLQDAGIFCFFAVASSKLLNRASLSGRFDLKNVNGRVVIE